MTCQVPDLSDPAKFLDSDTCAACHLYISVTGEEQLRFERHLSVHKWFLNLLGWAESSRTVN